MRFIRTMLKWWQEKSKEINVKTIAISVFSKNYIKIFSPSSVIKEKYLIFKLSGKAVILKAFPSRLLPKLKCFPNSRCFHQINLMVNVVDMVFLTGLHWCITWINILEKFPCYKTLCACCFSLTSNRSTVILNKACREKRISPDFQNSHNVKYAGFRKPSSLTLNPSLYHSLY